MEAKQLKKDREHIQKWTNSINLIKDDDYITNKFTVTVKLYQHGDIKEISVYDFQNNVRMDFAEISNMYYYLQGFLLGRYNSENLTTN